MPPIFALRPWVLKVAKLAAAEGELPAYSQKSLQFSSSQSEAQGCRMLLHQVASMAVEQLGDPLE
jgi:hypothetical protein